MRHARVVDEDVLDERVVAQVVDDLLQLAPSCIWPILGVNLPAMRDGEVTVDEVAVARAGEAHRALHEPVWVLLS